MTRLAMAVVPDGVAVARRPFDPVSTRALLPFDNGPDASPSVFATPTLPDGAEFVDGPAFCEDLGPRVVCGLGEVQAFGSVPSYPLTVRAPATEGTVTFTASIEGASIDPFAANDGTAFEVDVTDPGTEPPPAEPPPAEPPPVDDAPAIAVAQGPSSPPNAAVDVGATSVPALQVRVDDTGTAGAHVTSVVLRASGTGDDARDIARVGLVLDNDGNGTVGTGDSLLGTGAFAEDDGTLIVSVSTAVQAGSQQDWLVLGLGVLRFRRRGSWALAFAAATLWLAASACGATPPDDGGTTTTTHAIALDDLQATDLAGEETVVVTGLPVEGATLRVER